ncbi:hypothetical protein GCM10025879_17870 [Leuconostoc litchii]|uniref:DUF2075 domain-containing protein n=1 Tax=Leuconostoc litchii TaxID=1981069 RepID=A0A6P2CNV0_9LACO|nr:hypothetical protein [Leuconostoc litchii]TYC46671.1 hypothetical protein ESZ47_00610 [Leuconostoc litchii]GMA70541.1 hypothetical protein GCM10025879_17870 [Leuconostoc litchii]
MIQVVNLRTLASKAHTRNLKPYLSQLGLVSIREREIQGIKRLVNHFNNIQIELDNFYVGYSMPKVSKEFDLLVLDAQHRVINIELKSQADYDEDKIKKQLLSNKYYLSHITQWVRLFTYNSASDILYTLTERNELQTTDISSTQAFLNADFYNIMCDFNSVNVGDLDNIFQTQLYLVSPFKETSDFLKGKYLLTYQQQEFQKRMLSIKRPGVYVIKLSPSNGKTLMIYDTIQKLRKSNRVLLVYGNKLNATQIRFKRDYGWQILPIRQFVKKIKANKLQIVDYIFIDEAQNLSVKNLNILHNYFEKMLTRVILVSDSKSTLNCHRFLTIR